MEYLNIHLEDRIERGALNTAREISDQPNVWMKTYNKFLKEKEHILQFVQKVRQHEQDLIQSILASTACNSMVAVGNGYDENKFQFDLAVRFPEDFYLFFISFQPRLSDFTNR